MRKVFAPRGPLSSIPPEPGVPKVRPARVWHPANFELALMERFQRRPGVEKPQEEPSSKIKARTHAYHFAMKKFIFEKVSGNLGYTLSLARV
jgi:hypothetical protein